MKHIKSNDAYLKIYGGFNILNPPFQVGQRILQLWGMGDNGLKNGTEKYEFMGMKGDMMLLKSLNEEAAYSVDTVRDTKRIKGFNPPIGDIRQLHYKYADRFVDENWRPGKPTR